MFTVRDVGTGGIGCGLPRYVQNYEAAVWTIDLINKYNNNQGYLPGVRFGMEAFDTCTQVGGALRAVQEFYPRSRASATYCTADQNVLKLGMIGPMNSWESVPVAEALYRVPASTISMQSSASELSRKSLYPTFLRTYPSSSVFARAIIALFQRLNWQRVVAVYTDDNYGSGLYMEFLRAAYNAGLCVGGAIKVPQGATVDEQRLLFQGQMFSGSTAGIFFGSFADAQMMMQALQGNAVATNIKWLFSDLDLDADLSAFTAAQGAMYVSPSTLTIDEFRNYFIGLDERNPPATDPWLADWYMKAYKCKLPSVNYDPFRSLPDCQQKTVDERTRTYRQDPLVEHTILTIFAYAEAVRAVCGSTGVCSTLRQMDPLTFHTQYLSKVDFTFPTTFSIQSLRGRRIAFDLNGDPLTSSFTFYRYDHINKVYDKIATYMDGNVQMVTTATLPPPSTCPASVCVGCLQPTQDISLAYKSGDIVIAAIVNAHEPGTSGRDCGTVIPDRLIDAVAARYAADNAAVNSGLNARRVSVGYLIVDVCPGVEFANSFLTSLLGGFKQYVDSTGNIITTSNIVAVIDMTDEDSGVQMSPLLTQLKIPQIRVASTSAMYLNNAAYPMLVSAIPNQDTVQLSLVQMLSSLRWKYVQIISEPSGGYYRAAENFRRMASSMDICVALWSTFSTNLNGTVQRMLQSRNAPVVIVFGSRLHLRQLLESVKTQGAQSRLTFISGTVEWGDSASMISGYTAEVSGAITVGLAAAANTNFQTSVTSRDLNAISSRVFLAQWFQQQYGCALSSFTRGQYSRVCTPSDTITNVPKSFSPYVIRAVYTVASAVSSILVNLCPTSVSGICAQFRGATDIGKRITDYVKNSNSATNQDFQITNGISMTDLIFYNVRSGAYTNVGTFDTATRRVTSLMSITTATGVTADTMALQCTGRCLECQYMYRYQDFGHVPGDYLIASTFSIRNPGPTGQQPFVCGDIRTVNGFQYSAAMLYALDQVNSGRIVNLKNVTLGGIVMDHCNNERRAYGQVSDIYSGLLEMNWNQKMMGKPSFGSEDILAWMTDNTASTNEAAEILEPLGVAIVSPSATSDSLMDNPTFFRTVQGDGTVAMAIVKLCKSLGFSYIQVVHAADAFGRGGLESLKNTARQEGLCVINSYELVDASKADDAMTLLTAQPSRVVVMYMGTSLTTAFLQAAAKRTTDRLTLISPEPYTQVVKSIGAGVTNLLSLRLQNPVIADFNNYLNSVSRNSNNPFFALYYMKILGCNLPGYNMYTRECAASESITTDSDFEFSNFLLSTMNAVFSVAAALDGTLLEFCGRNYTQECFAFLQSVDMYDKFLAQLKIVSFTDPTSRLFKFMEREGNVMYDVLRFNGNDYTTVGSYGGASLVLNSDLSADYRNVRADCTPQCLECVFTGLTFSYTPGDIFLGGVFDVHSRGSGVFNCGQVNTVHGFQLLEAFHFALNQVNSKQGNFSGILKGVTLGGVGLDACESAIRGGYLVSNINNGLSELIRDGKKIQPDVIDTYIGPYLSDSSIYLAEILTDLKVPQISYAATSTTLDDQNIFPYFFRTVPTDDKQVLAMLQYLDKNNIRYVQLLYTDESYGQQGVTQFDRLIDQYDLKICVAQRVVFPESGVVSQESSNDVVKVLLQKPAANTTVIFAGTKYIRAFLLAVQRTPGAQGTLKFVGPTTWGNNAAVTNGIPAIANDAVTLMMDFQSLDEFESYMIGRTPSNSDNNPWFEEWYQTVLNCYTSPSNIGRFPRQCGVSEDLRNVFMEDPGVLHVINAVYSAAYSLDATLRTKCGNDYTAVCEAYRNSKDRRDLLRDNLDRVNFTDPTGARFQFVDRKGNKGYILYRVASSPVSAEQYNYLQIGEYTGNGNMTLYGDLPGYDGSCERKDACAECPTIRNRGARYAVGGDPNGKTTLIGIFDVHNQGTESYQCGTINMDGFQKFLTFFYTFTRVISIPGLRLIALDTCSNSMRVGQDLYGLLSPDGRLCNAEFGLTDLGLNNVGGIVVAGEDNTIAASRILEQLQVSYISPDVKTILLDDRQYLARTITPDSGLFKILAGFLKKKGWTYVNAIYVNSGLGSQQYLAFQQVSTDSNVCVGNAGLALPENPTDADITSALSRLQSDQGANVVVIFADSALTLRILRLAQALGITNKYFWVFGMEFESGLPDMQGITLQGLMLSRMTRTVDSFNEFVKNIQYVPVNENRNREKIPRVWWEDFYQTAHKCRLSDARYPLDFPSECTQNLFSPNMVMSAKYILNTLLAGYSAGQGLNSLFGTSKSCRSGETLSSCFSRGSLTRKTILDSILSVSWEIRDQAGVTNERINVTSDELLQFGFNRSVRYWDSGFDFNYLNVKNGAVEQTRWWTWQDSEYKAYPLSGEGTSTATFTSTCIRSDGCGCQRQSPSSAAVTGSKFLTNSLRNYYKYDSNGNLVYTWPVWAIVIAILTGVGLLLTLIVFIYLLIFYPVRGGTTILGYMVIIGILGIYTISFAFFVHAGEGTCGARRFCMGVVYSIVFAALLVKAVDNWRFAASEYGNHQYRGLTNCCSLFLIAIGIVLVQCIIPIIWLILVHPTATKWSDAMQHDHWWCDPYDQYDVGLVCSFIFVMFLVLLTGIFAALAWDSESNNLESRWILAAAICTAGCFFVWMIVSTNAGPVYRDPAVTIGNLINATLLLICIPLRKLALLCKAQNEKPMLEEPSYDPYTNVYSNQSFDPEGEDYIYEPADKQGSGFLGQDD